MARQAPLTTSSTPPSSCRPVHHRWCITHCCSGQAGVQLQSGICLRVSSTSKQPSCPRRPPWCWRQPGHRAADAVNLGSVPSVRPQVSTSLAGIPGAGPEHLYVSLGASPTARGVLPGPSAPFRAHSQASKCMSAPLLQVLTSPPGHQTCAYCFPNSWRPRGGPYHSQ